MTCSGLTSLLAPSRVAVIGSVSRPDRMGARTVRHLTEAGFPGAVEAVSDVAELAAGPIDVAIVAVPAAAVPGVLDAIGARTAHAVIYSSGFGEAHAADLRGRTGPMRILGPNTVGAYWAPSRAVLTFAQAFDDLVDCRRGPGVAIVSQSGAFGARVVRAARHRGLIVDGFVATGNEDGYRAADVLGELVALAADRPRVVALYLENVGDFGALRGALAAATAAGVHVVVLLGGRSAVGADAARSHTAAVSPDDAVVDELVRAHGGVVVRSDRELIDAAIALALSRPARGRRVAVVTGSGGAGVVAADLLAAAGADVAPLDAATRAALTPLLPSYAALENPVDVTAQVIADTDVLGQVVDVLARSGDIDAVLAVARGPQAAALMARGEAVGVPVVVAMLDGAEQPVAELVAAGTLALGDLESGVRATAALTRDTLPIQQRWTAHTPTAGAASATTITGDVVSSMRAVEACGVAVAPWGTATTAAEAVAVLNLLGAPVVMKANVAAGVHKAAAGAVHLDLVTPADVVAAFDAMPAGTREVLVARQLRGGPELFAGVRRDDLGAVVIVAGLGGGAMELLDRTVTLPADASDEWLRERIHDAVFRGAQSWAATAGQLASCASMLARLADELTADLVECNPLIPHGAGLVALDARVLRNESP